MEKNTGSTEGAAMPAQPEPVMTSTPEAPRSSVEVPLSEIPQQPARAVVPEPMPQQAEMQPVQQVERSEMPVEPLLRPIDLSAQGGAAPQGSAPIDERKRRLIIIAIVVVAGLIAGGIGFWIWNSMTAPTPTTPLSAQQEAQSVKVEVPQAVPVATPEADSLVSIENDLNALNATSTDAEIQRNLDAVNAAL